MNSKPFVISVIPGEMYVDQDHQQWYRHKADVVMSTCCTVCDQAIQKGQDYLSMSTNSGYMEDLLHFDCSYMKIPAELYKHHALYLAYRGLRNTVKLTYDVECQVCADDGKHVTATTLMPTYPFQSPEVTVFLPVCDECVENRDEPSRPDMEDIKLKSRT